MKKLKMYQSSLPDGKKQAIKILVGVSFAIVKESVPF